MAGIVGRGFNVEGSGLNEFIALLAPSSSGKESASKGAEILLNAVVQKVPNAAGSIGPGDVSSKAALQRYLSKSKPPSFVMFIGEFGEWLAPIVSPKASEARQSLRKMLLDLSEKGGAGSVLRKSAYADSEKNIEDVFAPAVSIVGDSVPETFFENVTEQNTGNGFFARFVILQSEEQVAPLNKDHASVVPSPQLVEELSSLCSVSLNLNTMNAVECVAVSTEARFDLDDFCRRCDEERDAATDNYKRAVWGRGYVHALRIAAILAVGRNPFLPTIDVCDASWSVALVTCSIEKLLCKFEDGEVGDVSQSEVARQTKIRAVINDWFTKDWASLEKYVPVPEAMRKAGYVPHKYLSKRLTSDATFKNARIGATNAIRNCIAEMVRNGELVHATDTETKIYTKSLAAFYRLAGGAPLMNPQMTDP